MIRLALALCLLAGTALAQTPPPGATAQTSAVAPSPREAAADGAEILVMLHLPAPHFRADGYGGASYRDDAGRAARLRIAAALAREYKLELMDDWAMPALNVDCFRMRLPAGKAAEPVLAALGQDSRVAWAQPIQEFEAQAGADPLYRVQPAALSWKLDELRKTTTGRKVLVAVVDSGVESRHPDLEGQVAVEENFVDGQSYVAELHGTAVAGVIAGRAGNGVGIEGVAPGARLMALRACWQAPNGTRCNSFTLAKALNFALLHDAQVINMSLSGPQDRLLQQLVEAARLRGVRVVGAVDAARPDGGFPANCPGVFAVAADGSAQNGLHPLLAPGRDIPTTVPGGRWGVVSGSSYAAAHVSGMLALLVELKPQLAPAQLKENIVLSEGTSALTGIDLCATIMRITGKCSCACQSSSVNRYVRSP
jgi:subtilisin family serine protease